MLNFLLSVIAFGSVIQFATADTAVKDRARCELGLLLQTPLSLERGPGLVDRDGTIRHRLQNDLIFSLTHAIPRTAMTSTRFRTVLRPKRLDNEMTVIDFERQSSDSIVMHNAVTLDPKEELEFFKSYAQFHDLDVVNVEFNGDSIPVGDRTFRRVTIDTLAQAKALLKYAIDEEEIIKVVSKVRYARPTRGGDTAGAQVFFQRAPYHLFFNAKGNALSLRTIRQTGPATKKSKAARSE